MVDQTPDTENDKAAAYVSWGTMKNAIEGFVQGVPNRIDRTVFPGMSGGTQSHLLAGLKFLGLITGEGKPTPVLQALSVPDEAARKKKLDTILHEKYADLFSLDLLKTTPALLEEKMGESYNVTGSTRDKAVRFFLSAVQYVGVPVSPLFRKLAGNGSATPRKRRTGIRARSDVEPTPPPEPQGTSGGGGITRTTVKLKSGGTLTVSATLDLFGLNEDDRTFVFELIDKLKKYEQGEGG